MPSPKSYIAPCDLAERIHGHKQATLRTTSPKPKEESPAEQASLIGIRQAYETQTGKKLGTPLGYLSFTTFGAKDTVTRDEQIRLLEAFSNMSVEHRDSKTAILLNQKKYKLMVAIIYLIQKDIRDTYTTRLHGYGVLHDLLNKALDTEQGDLDDNTKIECLSALLGANTDELDTLLEKPFTATQWSAIKASATARLTALRIRQTQDGPMATALGTTFFYLGQPLGYGTGYVIGKIIGESALVYPLVKVLDFLFRGLFSVTNRRNGGDHGRMASMFLAGKYSNEAAEYSCGIAGAMILGGALAKGGHKAGRKIGQGFDMLGEQTVNGMKHLYGMLADPKNKPVRMGIHVISGEPIFFNAKGECIDIDALSEELNTRQSQTATLQWSQEEEDAVRGFMTYIQDHPTSLTEIPTMRQEEEVVDQESDEEEYTPTP